MQKLISLSLELSKNEKEILEKVQQVYSRELSPEVPNSLRIDEANRPLYNLGDFERDMQIGLWSRKLQGGFLKPHAQRMIHWIVNFFQSQSGSQKNPPAQMVCIEFVDWIITLSDLKCDAYTLDSLRKRRDYLDTMQGAGCFLPLDPIIKLFSMLKMEIITVVSSLELKLSQDRESGSLESVINSGKDVLSDGFNYLYYLLSDTAEMPYPNITLFSSEDPIYFEVSRTRAGQLLTQLRQSPECCFIFPRDVVLGLTEKELSPGISPNPFLRSSDQSLLPSDLLQGADVGTALGQDLSEETDRSAEFSAGILKEFKNNPSLLEAFIELHALLKDWASLIVLCLQFSNRIKRCSRVLESDDEKDRFRLLMKTLQVIGDALSKCQKNLSLAVDRQASSLQLISMPQLSSKQKRWLLNFHCAKPVGAQFIEVIDACLNRARFLEADLLKNSAKPEQEKSVSLLKDSVGYFFGNPQLNPSLRTSLSGLKIIGTSKRAVLAPKVQTIRMGEVEYIRHPVEKSDDCGYTAFGIERIEAYKCLFQRIVSVRNIVKPVLQEVLFANEEFVNWLSDEYPGVKNASREYFAALKRNDPAIQDFWRDLNRCCENINLVDQLIAYNVLHNNSVGHENVHPLILCALAQSRGVSLRFYEIHQNGEMIPHACYKGHTPADATDTIELLVTENNKYEKVELKTKEDSLSRSNFGAGLAHFQPASAELPVAEVRKIDSDEKQEGPRH